MFLSKLFKRNAEAKEHLRDNRGDENVTKMIWVVIVFVVGALLLTIVSGAFTAKVGPWYNNTIDSWFNESNGMYATEGGNAGGQTPDAAEITFTLNIVGVDEESSGIATYRVPEGTTWESWLATNPEYPDITIICGGYLYITEEDMGFGEGAVMWGIVGLFDSNNNMISGSDLITADTYTAYNQ